MRWLALVVLAACSRVTSTAMDAAVDARPDARYLDAMPDTGEPPPHVQGPCDAPASFAESLTPTRILHVAPGAAGGDGSFAAPFGSIAAAAAVATPGTFIQLAPGVHATNQFLPDLRGTAIAPIWIGGVWGTRPIIRGGSEGIHLTRPAYVVLQNLEIEEQVTNGVNIDDGVSYSNDAHHVALINVWIHNVQSDASASCLRAAGVDQLLVHDSLFTRCAGGIDLIGVHHSQIARNQLSEMTQFAVQARGGSTDVDIRQNRIMNGGTSAITLGGWTPRAWFRPAASQTTPNAEARRVRAFNNFITGNALAAVSFVGSVDCLFAHNLTYGQPSRLIRILQGNGSQSGYTFEPTRTGRVINNSFAWGSLLSHVDVDPNTDPQTFTFSHNLWFSYSQPSLSSPTLPVVEDGSLIGLAPGYAPSGVAPYCGGPEANAAAPLPEVDGTYEGYCRAAGDVPTIGPQVMMAAECIPI